MSQQPVEITQFAGVNRSRSARDIENNEFVSTTNFYPITSKELGLRPNTFGPDLFASFFTLSESVGGSTPRNADAMHFQFMDARGNHRLLYWVVGYRTNDSSGVEAPAESRLYELASDGINGTFVKVWEGVGEVRPTAIPYRGSLYLLSREAGLLRIYAGEDAGNYGRRKLEVDESLAAYKFSGGCVYRDSFVYCGDDAHTVQFSNPLETVPLTLDKSLQVGITIDDHTMTAIDVSVQGGGQYIEPYCLIFKSQSVWAIYGNPPTSATLGNLSVVPLIKGEGLVSRHTLVRAKPGTLWCSGKNVWFAPHGGTPRAIAENLSRMLKDLPTREQEWNAVFHDGFYKLTVPTAESRVGPGGEQLTATEQWWCNLRDWNGEGQPTWWGPMTIPTMSMLVEDLPGDKVRLLGTFRQLTVDEVGVARVKLGTWALSDSFNGRDVVRLDGADSPVYEAMQAEIRGKDFDFGSGMLNKLIDVVELEVRVETPTAVQVEIIGNGGLFSSTAANSQAAVATGFVLDTSTVEVD